MRDPLRVLMLAVMGLVTLAGAGALGYVIGHDNNGLVEAIHTGMATETKNEGTATADGFSYTLPVNVSWIDSVGTIHQGPGPPPCLRAGHARRIVFATIKYPIAGAIQGIVVWVRC